MSSRIYEKIVDWLVPALLAGSLFSLSKVKDEMASLNVTMSVWIAKVEGRVNSLEATVYQGRRGQP